MNSSAIDWLGRGWLLLLAFTVAVLLVALLRKPCRHLFGTERAFQLWLLPPLAMLASQLPHGLTTESGSLPTVVYAVTSVAAALPAPASPTSSVNWRAVLLLCWLAGFLVALLLAGAVQWRYRRYLRAATPVPNVASRWPVLRAVATDVGPALVGAWHACIVLPTDFEQRYDHVEQILILAHESMHARRRDGWSCLFAQIIAALFWFHPLTWWALSALRHDQELACDAAVLREHGAQRRNYANAMLKTQSAALALPVGCSWSPRHPVTERIAMLKLKQPDPALRRAGAILVLLLAVSVAGVVYAATPSQATWTSETLSDHYTLKIDVAMGGHPDSMHFTSCVKRGEATQVSGTDGDKLSWNGSFAVSPVAGGQLEIRSQVDTRFDRGGGNVRTQSAKPIVRTMPGQLATIVFGQVTGGGPVGNKQREDNTIKIGVTPSVGCDKGTLASTWHPVTVSQQATNLGARAAAEALAAKAGFVLVNPQALDNRAVSFNFEEMPATAAMQLIADIDGMRAVFDDKRVHFERKQPK